MIILIFVNMGELIVWGDNRAGQLGARDKRKANPSPVLIDVIEQILSISCGEEHVACIGLSGSLYTIGSNRDGKLGLGHVNPIETFCPSLVEGLVGFKAEQVACGWTHTIVLTKEGGVFAWGAGNYGQLGTGSTESHSTPARVSLPKEMHIRNIACGARHSAMIASDLTTRYLFTWGANESGQLGQGHTKLVLMPTKVGISEDVKQASGGVVHTLILTAAGSVYATGNNKFFQLGVTDKEFALEPVRIDSLRGEQVIKVSCGHHSAALSSEGDVYIWGTGIFGEIRKPRLINTLPKIQDVNIGGCFGVALDHQGALWGWGSNSNGELGTADFQNRPEPMRIEALNSIPISSVSCGTSFVYAMSSETLDSKLGIRSAMKPERRGSFSSSRSTPKKVNFSCIEGSPRINPNMRDLLPSPRSSFYHSKNAPVRPRYSDRAPGGYPTSSLLSPRDSVGYSSSSNFRPQSLINRRGRTIPPVEESTEPLQFQDLSTHKLLESAIDKRQRAEQTLKDISLPESRQEVIDESSRLKQDIKKLEELLEDKQRELTEYKEKTKLEFEMKDQEIVVLREDIRFIRQEMDELKEDSGKRTVSQEDYEMLWVRCREVEDENKRIHDEKQALFEEVANSREQNRSIIMKLEEYEESLAHLERDNRYLQDKLLEAEAKNKELMTNLEKDLLNKAKEYREKTIFQLTHSPPNLDYEVDVASVLKSEQESQEELKPRDRPLTLDSFNEPEDVRSTSKNRSTDLSREHQLRISRSALEIQKTRVRPLIIPGTLERCESSQALSSAARSLSSSVREVRERISAIRSARGMDK
jgi:alpha-tubulin suppressor-like RCC1 family protein